MSVAEKPLHIDIPVKLSDVKAVFSIDALAFEGDLPALQSLGCKCVTRVHIDEG